MSRSYTKKKPRLPRAKPYHFQLYEQNIRSLVLIQEARLTPSASQVIRFCLDTVAKLVRTNQSGGRIILEHGDEREILDLQVHATRSKGKQKDDQKGIDADADADADAENGG